jgi:hypothetical protein
MGAPTRVDLLEENIELREFRDAVVDLVSDQSLDDENLRDALASLVDEDEDEDDDEE